MISWRSVSLVLVTWVCVARSAQDNSEDENVITCNVLVLGAGMAGVTVAKRLSEKGVSDLVVVEGSNRVGGRVKNVEFGGTVVELGANWIHYKGIDKNSTHPLEQHVQEVGLQYLPDDFDDYKFRYRGKDVTTEADTLIEKFFKAIDTTIEISDRLWDNEEPDVSYRDALTESEWKPTTPVEKAVEQFQFDLGVGEDPSDVGVKMYAEDFSDQAKPDLFVTDPRGFSTIIQNIADKIPLVEGENLHLNKYVTHINYNEEGEYPIKVTAKDQTSKASQVYRSKWIVVTFSVGVLSSGRVTFSPRLPVWKENSIHMFGMVTYIKIFVKFPSNVPAFWDDNDYIVYVDPHTKGKYPVWKNMEAHAKAFPTGTNILFCVVVGKNWQRLATLNKEQVKQEMFTVLKDMYGDKAVMPEDILIPDWHTNPLFFGTYASWPLGVTDTHYEDLVTPVGPLYWAGEACAEQFGGTVHGAEESGNKTADLLHRCMVHDQCETIRSAGSVLFGWVGCYLFYAMFIVYFTQ